MTHEEKLLLLIDLCARLPYGVKITCFKNGALTPYLIDFRDGTIHTTSDFNDTYVKVKLEDCKLYLHSMDNMTDNQQKEYGDLLKRMIDTNDIDILYVGSTLLVDFFNREHIDCRGLIEKGLALEAPEDMYNLV